MSEASGATTTASHDAETRTDFRAAPAITRRSVVGGLFFMALLAILTPFAEYRMHSVELFQGELPIGALAILVVGLIPLNWLLARYRPAWRLTVPEIIFMFIMGFAGLMVYHIGMMGLFLSMISSPHYFASPVNRYAEYLHPHLPTWAVAPNNALQMTWFYNGLPAGHAIPWEAWVVPLIWWWTFFIAFLLVCSSITAIVRKQWFDNEKIVFPQAEITLSLIQGSGQGNGLPTMLRSRSFWWGAAIPVAFIAWNIVNYFTPSWPRFGFTQDQTAIVIRGFSEMYTKPDFFIIGFMYFVDTNIVFSLWFFRFLVMFQDAAYTRLGVVANARNDLWTTANTFTAWQSLGGMVIWILIAMWMGRHHLRAVWERVRDPSGGADDSNELLSYRTSFMLLVGGLIYMLFWLTHLGMSIGLACAFLLALTVLVTAVTRIVALSGMPFVGAPVTSQGIVTRTIGDANLGAESWVGVALSLAAFRMIEGYPMPMVMHAARLGDAVQGRRRSLFVAILAGSAIAMVLMSLTTIILAYNGGAFNFGQHHAFSQMTGAYDHIVTRMRDPWPREPMIYGHFAAGATLIALLSFIRYRVGWSGIHPVGFFTAGTFYHGASSMSFLLAWIIKVAIQKVGGLALYERGKPFFLGLIAGQVFGAMISLVMDYFFFIGEGHDIVTGIAF